MFPRTPCLDHVDALGLCFLYVVNKRGADMLSSTADACPRRRCRFPCTVHTRCMVTYRSVHTHMLLDFSEVFSALAIGTSWRISVTHAFEPPEVSVDLSFFSLNSFSFSSYAEAADYGCPAKLSFLSIPHSLLGLSIYNPQHQLSPCLHRGASPHPKLSCLTH